MPNGFRKANTKASKHSTTTKQTDQGMAERNALETSLFVRSQREKERTRIARLQCANSTKISNNRRINLERQSDEANKKSHKQHLT